MSLVLPVGYKLGEDAAQIFNLLNHSFDNLLISGRAGTGKSSLLAYFQEQTEKNYIILAPTGVAAMNVGGQTIHSFFGFPLRSMRPDDPDIQVWPENHPRTRILRQLDMIIIDEISMVRADMLDAIDESLRLNLGKHDEPFGGLQIVLVGDAYQLAPVDNQNEEDQPGLPPRRQYKSSYFFSAQAFGAGRFKIFELTKVYRQTEGPFLDVLNQVRLGELDKHGLELLNRQFNDFYDDDHQDNPPILLTSVNYIADQENIRRLAAIDADLLIYKADVANNFPLSMCRADEELKLKIGARVMLINNDPERRWINGSIGTLLGQATDEEDRLYLRVMLDRGGEVEVMRHRWENISYKLDRESNTINKEVKGSLTQFPVKLAWAVTIHKSQGLTFDSIRLDLGRGAFAPGQLYVALSRCRTLNGIKLLRALKPEDVIVDPIVRTFYNWAERQVERQDNDITFYTPRRPAKPVNGAFSLNTEEAKRKQAQKKEARKQEQQNANLKAGKLANEGRRYSKEDLDLLRQRFNEGYSLKQIGALLERKPSGIGSKLKDLGFLVAFSIEPAYIIVKDADDLQVEPEEEATKPAEPLVSQTPWGLEEDQALINFLNHNPPEAALLHFELGPVGLLAKMARLQLVGQEGLTLNQHRLQWRPDKF